MTHYCLSLCDTLAKRKRNSMSICTCNLSCCFTVRSAFHATKPHHQVNDQFSLNIAKHSACHLSLASSFCTINQIIFYKGQCPAFVNRHTLPGYVLSALLKVLATIHMARTVQRNYTKSNYCFDIMFRDNVSI